MASSDPAAAPESSDSNLASELSELRSFVDQSLSEVTSIHDQFIETKTALNASFRTMDSILSKHRHQRRQLNNLQQQLSELQKEFPSDVSACTSTLSDLSASLTLMADKINTLGRSKRRTGSRFVAALMGDVSVRIWNEGERFRFKSAYNRFKELMLFPMFIVLPLLHLLLPAHPTTSTALFQAQSILGFFYYSALAIRENILSLNGSRIEPWWIYHHYWSMGVSVLLLLIAPAQRTMSLVGAFSLWQGAVMLLQNDYQRRRHYAMKALAKKGQLDVRTSEVLGEGEVSGHRRVYALLIPALFVTYGFQVCLSLYFLWLASDLEKSALRVAQTLALSVAWFVIAVGNTSTLSRVLRKKKDKSEADERKKDK